MKKIIWLILAAVTIFSFAAMGYGIEAEEKETIDDTIELKDINNHWAKSYIEKLVKLGSIAGYPNGDFKPENTITNAEFTKILLASLGSNHENSKDGHWAKNYIEEAKALSVIDKGDFKNLDSPITRGQMAKMIVRASNEQTNDLSLYERQLEDIDKMSADTKYYVANCYGLGIITGYEDGTFKHERTATRAEATTMIIRLLDEKERKIPIITESGKWTHKQFVEFLKRKDAYKTVSVFYFEVVDEGKLKFTESNYTEKQEIIADESNFPNLNKIVYNTVKDLTQLAHEGGYYVRVFYNKRFEAILIKFYEEERVAEGGKNPRGDFGVVLRTEPQRYYEETKDLSYVTVNLGRLWRMKDALDNIGTDYIKNNNYRHTDFVKGFKDMVCNVYGEEDGKLIYEYALQEYEKEYETDGQREDQSLITIGNIEVRNFNLEGIDVHFTTNIKKK